VPESLERPLFQLASLLISPESQSVRAAVVGLFLFAGSATLFADSRQQIELAEEELRQAFLQADVPVLQRLLADEYKVVHVNGRQQNKAQFIESLESGRAKFLSAKVDEMEVRDFGDTAVAIARWTNTIEFKGERHHGQDRVTDVWMKRPAGWQVVTSQAAFLEDSQAVPSPAAADDEKEILRMEKVIVDAWLRHDTAAVSGVVADDFESWSFKGKRRGKAELLKAVEKNSEEATRVDDQRVRVFGDAAVYTARVTDSAKDKKGASFEATTVVTAVFLRREGKWQMVQNHDSLVAADPTK
jgi:uncharacterized protein (TIGR02246 family)